VSTAAAAEALPDPERRRVRAPGGIAGFIFVRILLGILTLFVISLLVFATTQLLPGDPARARLGKEATPAAVAAIDKRLGLDRPAWKQYTSWLGGLLHGDLGESLTTEQPIWNDLSTRLRNTLFLVFVSAAISIPLAIFLGSLAALKRDGLFDEICSFTMRLLSSIPEFVVAILLVTLFSTTVFTVLPAISLIPPGADPYYDMSIVWLPMLTLVLVVTPYVALIQRGAMVEVLESEYIEMARLKGVPERTVLWRHGLPNALGPTFQVIALNLAYLAGGIIVVETVFQWAGIGVAMRNAVYNRDFPTAQAVAMIIAGVYVVVNLVADVATVLVTPRLRTKYK
jgi:peptide/nickel transport system permease protein